MTASIYRLGAEELIELGSSRKPSASSRMGGPFLSGRKDRQAFIGNRPTLGITDILATIGTYLVKGLEFAFNALGDFIDIPMNILSQGIDIVFVDGLAGILRHVPLVGDLLAEIVVLGASVLKFGLSLPGLALHGLGNVMGNIATTLEENFTEAENQNKVDQSKEEILEKAPDELKDNVKALLDASGVSGSELVPGFDREKGKYEGTPPATDEEIEQVQTGTPPKSDLEKALLVGAPVAGVAAILLLVG